MGKSMSSKSLEARLLLPQPTMPFVRMEIAAILHFMVYNRVHSLFYWLPIFNCSIIRYLITVSLEKSPCLKALLHSIYARA